MFKVLCNSFAILGILMGTSGILHAQTVTTATTMKDAEASKHGSDAAQYSIVDTYQFPGFAVVQIDLGVLSQYSYMVFSDKECLVVDPGRDVDVYVDKASKESATIKGVYLTHSHADFVAVRWRSWASGFTRRRDGCFNARFDAV